MQSKLKARAAIVSIVCNLLLVLIKLLAGYWTFSLALKVDALHSFSDVIVSTLVLGGVFFSRRFPKWVKTVENSLALLISLLILFASLGIFVRVFQYPTQTLENIPVGILLVWVCILISYGLSVYQIRVARENESPSLEADGFHSRMDMFSSVAVLVCLLGNWIGMSLDSLASLAVAVLIFKLGIELFISSIQGLQQSEITSFETALFVRNLMQGKNEGHAVGKGIALVQRYLVPVFSRVSNYGRRYPRRIGAFLVVLLVLAYFVSGFFCIQPNETGLLLKFGKLSPTHCEPGLHYRLPYPMTRLHRVQPDAVQQLEFGFRTIARRSEATEPNAYLWESAHMSGIYEKHSEEAIMLTGDKNEVDANLVLEYHVAPQRAAQYLFHLADTEATVRAVTESCLRRTIGVMPLTEVLTTQRDTISEVIFKEVQQQLDTYQAGIALTAVRLQEVHPPVTVVPAFRGVATAREDRATEINRAISYHNATLPNTRGAAKRLLADAEAYTVEKKLSAEGDTAYFRAMTEVFQESPEAVAFLMHLDCIEDVLPSVRKLLIDPNVKKDARRNPLTGYFMAGQFLNESLMSLNSYTLDSIAEER